MVHGAERGNPAIPSEPCNGWMPLVQSCLDRQGRGCPCHLVVTSENTQMAAPTTTTAACHGLPPSSHQGQACLLPHEEQTVDEARLGYRYNCPRGWDKTGETLGQSPTAPPPPASAGLLCAGRPLATVVSPPVWFPGRAWALQGGTCCRQYEPGAQCSCKEKMSYLEKRTFSNAGRTMGVRT